jgi:hypothetical protein
MIKETQILEKHLFKHVSVLLNLNYCHVYSLLKQTVPDELLCLPYYIKALLHEKGPTM